MSKTGVYLFDEKKGKVVKISDEIPKIPSSVWFPMGGHKYFDRALQKEFYSKTEKRDFLKSNGMREIPQEEKDTKRFERCAAIVNEERKKTGLREKTVNELRGDTIYQ